MPLLTYEQARPWAKAIRAAVLTGKMPPWQADPHYGKFSNDLSLAPGEKEKLIAWVDAGAKEGNPADAPKPQAFPEGWRIPKPDVVFEMPEDFDVPAKGVHRLSVHPRADAFHRRQMGGDGGGAARRPDAWCITPSWWSIRAREPTTRSIWRATLRAARRRSGSRGRRA